MDAVGWSPEAFYDRGMYNTKQAAQWEEAYASGNGTLGVLAMGDPLDETLILNHEKLFLPLPVNRDSVIPDMSDLLPIIRSMIMNGKYAEATDLFLRKLTERGFPDELVWTDPFHPAFDLKVRMEQCGEIRNYRRWLNFVTGESGVAWNDDYGGMERRLFVSRADEAVVIRLTPPSGGRLDCSIGVSERPGGEHIKSTGIGVFGSEQEIRRALNRFSPPGSLTGSSRIDSSDGGDAWLLFYSLYEVKGGYYGIVRVHVSGGSMELTDKGVEIRASEGALVFARVIPFDDPDELAKGLAIGISEGSAEEASRKLIKEPLTAPTTEYLPPSLDNVSSLASLPADYDMLLSRHTAIHGELFERVRLDLCGGADRLLSNEELMRKAAGGDISNAFFERLHDLGRYLLISSSGKLPPNLQGVWNGIWNPPWSSDYTLDENLQMMMWQVLPGNLPELSKSCFDLIESFVGDWKTNARLFYGCRGIFSSIRSTTSGLHKHFCRDYPMMFWTAGAGWLAQLFYDYWLFTGDREFLEKHAVPYMKEVALFYEDFLIRGPDGKYMFIPSYSPENTPSNSDSPAAVNAAMDIAVAKELFSNLIDTCKYLGTEPDNVTKWESMLDGLPGYLVNEDGALKEWAWPGLYDDYHHRHSSLLYPVFPGFEATPGETAELYGACLRAAELRLTDGLEAITGWGLAHLANTSARLKDSKLVYGALSRIMRKFLLPNLFTSHNVGELFQMDANLGFTSAVLEMLVFSKPGLIELLPALPEQFPRGCITGVLCRGHVSIIKLQWDIPGKLIFVNLRPGIDNGISLRTPYNISSVSVGKDREQTMSSEAASPVSSGNAGAFSMYLKLREDTDISLCIRLK